MQLSSKLDVCEVRALRMRNGLYRYTFLCKEIAFLQAKKKFLQGAWGRGARRKKKKRIFYFLLLSNSTKNLNHKRTYGILFLKHFLFSFLSPPKGLGGEKKKKVSGSQIHVGFS